MMERDFTDMTSGGKLEFVIMRNARDTFPDLVPA